jgi:hypothetical protein
MATISEPTTIVSKEINKMEDTSATPAVTEKRTALERAILNNRKVLTSLSTSALLFDVYEISSANDEAKLDILDELKARDECSYLVVVLGVTNP